MKMNKFQGVTAQNIYFTHFLPQLRTAKIYFTPKDIFATSKYYLKSIYSA